MTSMSRYGVGSSNNGSDAAGERLGRRRKLAAMAGSVYRAGAVAVNEIKESYNQTRSSEDESLEISKITIPGSFPNVAIITKGNEQMVLFPSYAKRHVKERPGQVANPAGPPQPSSTNMNEEEYWRQEWARHEDEKAIMDVDVRGWIYNPHKGPMTRRNRVLIGLARQLSGIPPPRTHQVDNTAGVDPSSSSSLHQQREEEKERESIAREAREIERKGHAEKAAAEQGGYSERPKDEDSEEEGDIRRHTPSGSQPPSQVRPPSPTLSTRTNTLKGSALSDAELAVANANLMARIGPFMTTPLVALPITLFFYNDTQSQSRTVMTDDSGHFVTRAALDFVPTHVRVLANEDISCTEEIQVIEPQGVSLISDIDDTIKRSNISLGAKEIFRNTFVRELGDLTIDGVKDWYTSLHDMGVRIHYCSNSPWQLYPVIATYFKLAGLPPGSLHLKRYTGMLQGIFEPVAERKKGTLEKIMNDFPERKFLLVGDSGEADLEVYTELAVAYPDRIKAIFIRDVTTPEPAGYFDSAYDTGESPKVSRTIRHRQHQNSRSSSSDEPKTKPTLPPRSATTYKPKSPIMGDLIDFSDEPLPIRRTQSGSTELRPQQTSNQEAQASNLRSRKPPPPRPVKPSALQSSPTISSLSTRDTNSIDRKTPPAPPPPRPSRSFPVLSESTTKSLPLHPLSQIHNSDEQTPEFFSNNSRSSSSRSSNGPPPPPPPPRRRGTPSSSSSFRGPSPGTIMTSSRQNSDVEFDLLPSTASGSSSPGNITPPADGRGSPNQAQPPPLNKKLELWRRRLDRAQETLGQHGVPLYTWRRGDDVVDEALGIVRDVFREMELKDFNDGDKS